MPKQEPSVPESTAAEPELPPNQMEVFQDVLRTLEQHRLPCAVSGAFALRHHTEIWRTTKDLDLFLTADAASRALDLLCDAGFQCEVCDPVWLAKAHRDGFFVDLITGMSNATLRVRESWIARSLPALVVGVPTRILAAEELLASKLFVTRRERFDGADIAHIVYATRGKLDWNRILELAGPDWEILLWALLFFRYAYPAQCRYVPLLVWAELINGLMSGLVNQDPAARFRGSLLDDKMFAIDVKDWGLDDLLTEYRTSLVDKILWSPGPRKLEGAA